MMIEHRATGPGDVQKADLSSQESRDGGLVGGVERRAGRPAPPHHFESQGPDSGNVSRSGGSKCRENDCAQIEPGARGRDSSRGRSGHTEWAIACRAERAVR